MTEVRNITCDGCGEDLTTTTNMVDYRLALIVKRIPSAVGFVTCMGVQPPIDRDAHFCGLACLRKWLQTIAGTEG